MSRYFPHQSDSPHEVLDHIQNFLARAFRGSVPRTLDPRLETLTRASGSSGGGSGGGGGGGSSVLFGDVTGPPVGNTVSALQGETLTLGTPAPGQGIEWNGSAWINSHRTPGVKEIEVDFGSVNTRYFNGTITDADVQPGTFLVFSQSRNAATGRSADEAEMDPLLARATTGVGSFVLSVTALEGPVVGKYRLSYAVGW